jgi:hypothetical protein
MKDEFCVGSPVYYVPECGKEPAQYVPVTRVHSSLKPPLLTLGRQLVIAPKLTPDGMLARDKGGSFWISKEAFETAQMPRHRRPQGGGFRLNGRLAACLSRIARACVPNGVRSLPKWRPSGKSASS